MNDADTGTRSPATAALCGWLLALLTGFAPAASARPQPTDKLEEVIVTAQFRDTRLLASTGSISVVSQATLDDRGAEHLEETLNVLPNVNFSSGASRARFIQVRGVGDLEQFVDPKYFPSVGVTIDDVDMNGLATAAVMLDVRQVEILRGPQGTRFGTNALAGMVNISSNEPTDYFTGYAKAGVGNFNSRNAAAALSGPLAESLLGRIAVQQNRGDGFIRNDYLGRDNTNNRDELGMRGKLRWLGDGDNHTDLTVFYTDIDNGYDAFSLDNTRHTLSDQPGHDRQETFAAAIRNYWHFTRTAAAETILGYQDSDTSYGYDEDWTNPDVCAGFTACYPYANTDEQTRGRKSVSLDVHLLSVAAGRLDWVAGVYAQYRNEDFTRRYYGPFDSHYETRRYAAYGQLDYALADRWKLTGGLRLEKFSDDYGDSNALVTSSGEHYFTGEVSLKHDLADGTLLYATIARGVKPGGVNTEASSVSGLMAPKFRSFMQDRLRFGSESLLNKEIGIKGRYLGDTLSVRADVFHMDRRDAQLESWIWDDINYLWVGYLDSVASGTNYGAELEFNYRPAAALELFGGLGWLRTDIAAITVVDLGAPGQYTQSTIRLKKGRDQTKAPEWQYNLGASLALTPRLGARVEVEGRSGSYYGYYHDQRIGGYGLVNASVSYSGEAYTVRLWGRNLGNRDHAVHALYFGNDPRKGYVNESYLQYGEPRVYGVELEYRFR